MRTPACSTARPWHGLPSIAALLAAASLTLVACGSDTPDQPAAADPAVASTPATSPSTTPDSQTADEDTEPKTESAATKADESTDEAVTDGADESIASNTDPSAPAGTVDSAPGVGDAQVPVVTADQEPITITVGKGDLVAFRAVSGSDEQVSIQAYGKPYAVSAGVSRIIRFTASKPGKFAITFGEMDKLVGTLVVED